MPLSFSSDVLEVMYDAEADPEDIAEVRQQNVALYEEAAISSGGELFRVGTQVVLDPPRNMQVTPEWQRILEDAQRVDGDDAVRGIIVAVRSAMLACEEPFDLENAGRQAEELSYVYSVLLHGPPKNAGKCCPTEGDRVTLTCAATKRFVGGVLKSSGNPEGACQTFPVGIVTKVSGLRAKVCLMGSEECSWYDFSDLSVIDDWDRRFKEEIPEDWLRGMNFMFSSQIEHKSLQELLQSNAVYRIPVFQRRYCWTQLQWRELWRDVTRMGGADSDAENHSLGRVLMRQREDGSQLILDGQQRLTTIILLLSALHDRLSLLGEMGEAEVVQKLLGEERLIPTLDDRTDFRRCLQEANPEGDGPLLEAKRLFSSFCEEVDARECVKLVSVLLQRFSVMTFILQTDQRLQVIYHMMSTGWGTEGSTPGIEMSPVDFIRNFVLENFADDEQMMRNMHSQYWSPLEIRAGSVEGMEQFFEEFLSSRGFPTKRDEMYDNFEAWWKTGIMQQQVDLAEYAISKLNDICQFL